MLHDPKAGCVLLVGAGPGPVDLMTLRAVRAVESAQAPVTTTAAQIGLTDGAYTFRATVTDAAGNSATTAPISVTVDTAATAGTLLLQALRTGILALFVTPDAVVGFIESAGQIGAFVRQLEPGALAQTGYVKPVLGISLGYRGLRWHQILEIQLVRRLEQHAVMMSGMPGFGMGCPSRVLQREIQRLRMTCLILLPFRNVISKHEFSQRLPEQGFEFAAHCRTVDTCSGIGLVLVHGLALHEQALDAVERRQLVMLPGQGSNFGRDTEQLSDKIIEMRRQCQQQFGFIFCSKGFCTAPRRRRLL